MALVKAPRYYPNPQSRTVFREPPKEIRGLGNITWMGPLQPVAPLAPPGTTPRGWQYYPGQNLIYTPRANEFISAEELREFAKYPLVRYIIETRKDQICRKLWQIRGKKIPDESGKERRAREAKDPAIKKLTTFFTFPNPDCSWRDFIKMLADDTLVIDAASILLRKNKAGEVVQMRAIDGALITKYIDENGWTPQNGDPAYAQLWYNIPMVDLSTDDLVYRPWNPRTNKLYGYSKVEQAIQHITLGQRRLEWQLANYDSSNIPEGIMIVPPTATPEQIERQQNWLNSTLAGNIGRRTQLRLVQGFNIDDKPEQILFPKLDKLIMDETDDMLARVLCFCFSVSPHALQKMMNRATAQTSQESSEEEGLDPILNYLADTMNYIIQIKMGFVDYEFAWMEPRETDIAKQALADEIYVKNGIKTINQVLIAMGEDPSDNPDCDKNLIITGQGTVEVGKQLQPAGGGRNANSSGTNVPPTRAVETPGGKIPKCTQHNEFTKTCRHCLIENLAVAVAD